MTGRRPLAAVIWATASALALASGGCLRREDPEVLRQRAVIEELTRKNVELALEIERLRRELAAVQAGRGDNVGRHPGGAP